MEFALARLAERQHGLLKRSQALEHLTLSQLDWKVRTGTFLVAGKGVYRVAGSVPTWEQSVLAAVLAAPVSSVASHGSAARLWGLSDFGSAGVDILIHRACSGRIAAATVRTTRINTGMRSRRFGIPVTSGARTIVDLAAHLSTTALARALDEALGRRVVSLESVQWTMKQVGTRGRNGTARLAELLEERMELPTGIESPLHRRACRWLVQAGITDFVVERRVVRAGKRRRYLDIAWPSLMVAIETDGFIVHSTRSAFDDDRVRNNALVLAGWLVLHFTSNTPREEFLRTVRTALDSRRSFAN